MEHKFLEQLDRALETELLAESQALNEHELIQRLQQAPYELFSASALSGSLRLFQTHFIVFNALYRLREKWREEQLYELSIHTLKIEKRALPELDDMDTDAADMRVGQHDALASYYLDWAHFEKTRVEDVDALLDGFWQSFSAGNEAPTSAEVVSACEVMDVPSDIQVDAGLLKKRYRQLLHQHHPDKGGTHEQVQRVKWAYSILQTQAQ